MFLKNLFKQPLVQFILLFLLVNSVGALGFFIFLPRSLFYYEYALVLLALVYSKNLKTSFLLFILFFILDIFDIFSTIYLFAFSELFSSLQFIALYKINWQQILYIILLITYLALIYFVLKQTALTVKSNKNLFLKTLFILYSVLILLDFVNGSSKLAAKNDTLAVVNKNIVSSLLLNYIQEINQSLIHPVKVTPLEEIPVVFKNFKDDSAGNQLIITIESWGLINDSITQEALQAYLSTMITKKGYNTQWGTSPFNGPTTSAAMRQLVGVTGKYEYFFHHKTDTNSLYSIFDYKKKQGYTTYGFHSFSGNMFNRVVWWKNIGIQHTHFKENYLLDNVNGSVNIVKESSFPSINDTVMFNYMLTKTNSKNKIFSYLLTENTHLPFKMKVIEKDPTPTFKIDNLPISEEAQNQLKLIKNTISNFIQKLDTNQWNKIILIGDHSPPYLDKRDRGYYSKKLVPFVLLYK